MHPKRRTCRLPRAELWLLAGWHLASFRRRLRADADHTRRSGFFCGGSVSLDAALRHEEGRMIKSCVNEKTRP